MKIVPIINPDELLRLSPDDIVVIDARSGPNARTAYAEQHLKGALHVDLDTQLSSVKPNPADGGRHPLPAPQEFAQVLESLGISPQTGVVVYDDKNGANAAARFWWMMRAAGHTKIQVVNGGLNGIIAAGLPLVSGVETATRQGTYLFSDWVMPAVTMSEVAAAATDIRKIIIDVREKERFDGIREPIDLVAGHIPGAINVFFASNLDENGMYLPAKELAAKYGDILQSVKPEDVIVHCGSGVTACHTLLAMEYAGIEGASLYVGSWSEWSRNH